MRNACTMAVALFAIAAAAGPGRAESAERVEEVRGAVRRGLALLEKEGVAWITERKCISCHHVPFLVWTHQAAANRGIEVDPKKTAEWTEWMLAKSMSLRVWFRLSEDGLTKLKEDGVPGEFVAKLKPLAGEAFTTEAEFVNAVGKAISTDETARHRAALVKRAALDKTFNLNDGGAINTLSLISLGRLSQESPRAAEFPGAMHETILRWQEPTGVWRAENQFKALQRGVPEADESTTLWALLALSDRRPRDDAATRAIDGGLKGQKDAPEPKSNETRMARLMVERRLGSPEKAERLRKDLLDRQNADGGWGGVTGAKSDALATGEMLFVLASSDVAIDAPALVRARDWLLAAQEKDGGWPSPMPGVSDRNTADWSERCNPIYRYWANGWAVLGLLETLPGKDK